MKCLEGANTYESIPVIETHRITIKDVEGRVNQFANVKVEICYILGDKFYKVRHDKGVEYYNPRNIVFLEF